jgi:hypothetical protein
MIDMKMAWIQEPIVYDYFLKLNQGDFSGVCQLFTAQGCLHAPFKSAICGRTAIYEYLQTEAREVTAVPQSGSVEARPDGGSRYQLKGQVHTPVFTVNVGWTIDLDATKAIVSVTVTLLAELQELLGLRS